MKLKKWVFMILILAVFFSLNACSGPDEHIWLKTPGWSRAAFLGNTTVNDPVPMAMSTEGNLYFLLFDAEPGEEEKTLNLIARDGSGSPLWEKSFEEISLRLPDNPQLIWEDGQLQTFWTQDEALYTLPISGDGTLLGEPRLVSADIAVGAYSLSVDSRGEHTLWFSGPRENPGVYALSSFDGNGELLTIDPDGSRIQLRYDQENNLHATWVQYPLGHGRTQIYYGVFPADVEPTTVEPEALYELTVGPSNGLSGPILGIDEDTTYLFWTVTVRSGLEAGAVQTSYMHFPLGQPAQVQAPSAVAVPSDYSFEFETFMSEELHAGERVLLESAVGFRTTELEEFVPNSLQTGEMAVIFRSPTQHLWRKVRNQVNMVYFDAGQATSYQPLSFTTVLSTSPNLYNDADDYLYATWLEKIETNYYAVYFASTAPTIEETFGQSSGRELGRVLAQISFGMLVGILMAPVAAGVLVVAPLIILFLTAPLRRIGSERIQDIFSAMSLIFAVFAFWLGKFAVFPAMLDYVPFSAWIPEISATIGESLRYGVPIFTGILAIFVAWFYTYRQSNKSTLYFILIYVGVDSAITAAIYGVLIYGAI